MPTIFTHAVAAVALAPVVLRPPVSRPLVVAAGVAAMLPDLDVIGFRFGIEYGDPWGHRGFTHSISFAALVGLALLPVVNRHGPRFRGWLFLFLAIASHGLLDAFTDGGLGIALLAPLDWTRYFFPWRPIAVSPIGVGAFFSSRGWAVIASELLWVWLPSGLLAGVALLWSRASRR